MIKWMVIKEINKINQKFLPPGVVEYKVPPGVDEYNSGNWLASVTRTRFDGIVCAWEHAWRAIGDADIFQLPNKISRKKFVFFLLHRSTLNHNNHQTNKKKMILKNFLNADLFVKFNPVFYLNFLFTDVFDQRRESFFTSVLDDLWTQTKLSMNKARHFKPLTKQSYSRVLCI